MATMISIHELYRERFRPVPGAKRSVERLLQHVPSHYMSRLGAVVLTETGVLNHQRRREMTRSRKRKVAIIDTLGLYHPTWKKELAWIELFLDNITSRHSRPLLWLAPVRDTVIANVLYHELGHHLHATQAPEYREKENVADEWSKQLALDFFLRRYWYILPIAFVCTIFSGFWPPRYVLLFFVALTVSALVAVLLLLYSGHNAMGLPMAVLAGSAYMTVSVYLRLRKAKIKVLG